MYKGKNILCIIPARGGSKGLPGKNTKILSGKPLIAYSILQARASRFIDRIIVSTDSRRIAAIARRYGAEVPFMRPSSLARDNSPTIPVLRHAVKTFSSTGYKPDIVLLLHVTTPLRNTADIDACIKLLDDTGAENVFSVTDARRNPYFNMVEIRGGKVGLVKNGDFGARQQAPEVYDMNSSIYAWETSSLMKLRPSCFNPNTRIYKMPPERSVDIDGLLDFKIAEMLLSDKKTDARK